MIINETISAPLLYCYVCDDCPNTLSPLRHMAACPDSSHVSCITTLTTFAEFKSKFFTFIRVIITNCKLGVEVRSMQPEKSPRAEKLSALKAFRPQSHAFLHLLVILLLSLTHPY